MKVGQPKKYVASVDGETFVIGVDGAGVTVNDQARAAELECAGDGPLFSLLLGTQSYEVFIEPGREGYDVTVDGERYHVSVHDEDLPPPRKGAWGTGRVGRIGAGGSAGGGPEPARAAAGPGAVTSPMTGVLVEFLVQKGQNVKAGDGLAILEAMKTENVIRSLFDGIVRSLEVATGQTVRMDDVVLYVDVTEG